MRHAPRCSLLSLLVLPLVAASALNGPGFRTAASPDAAGFSPARLARIDSMVNEAMAAGAIPGAVVFIARHGEVVLHKAYGVRDLSTRVPLQRDDIFRIASQSKAVTALAAGRLPPATGPTPRRVWWPRSTPT